MRRRRSDSTRLTLFSVAVCAALALNNALPYLGLRDDSCQTMFSGLIWSADANNHSFVPQHAVSDLWVYWTDVHAEIHPAPASDTRAGMLARWLGHADQAYNDEALRVVVHQICDEGHRVTLVRRRGRSGPRERIDDACNLAPRWWIPVRLYETRVPAVGLLSP